MPLFTFTITNHTGVSLNFTSPQNSYGALPTTQAGPVQDGKQITVTLNSDSVNEGIDASFVLNNQTPQFAATVWITIQIQQKPEASLIHFTVSGVTTPGYIGYTDQEVYPYTTSKPMVMTLYKGHASQVGWTVPLASGTYAYGGSNISDFINSMFSPNVRSSGVILTAEQKKYADYSGQLQTILKTLQYCWMQRDVGQDLGVLNFLKEYLVPTYPANQTPMTMWVPNWTYEGGSLARYQLSGYTAVPLVIGPVLDTPPWSADGVGALLTLLLTGAHFVAISATQDFVNQGITKYKSRSLYGALQKSKLPKRWDPANSHYRSEHKFNTTGYYYPDNVEREWAQPGCGYIISLLIGSTVNDLDRSLPEGTYNSFMQLEGWPYVLSDGGERHKADYETHQQTLWNISTYGACPYSEKRGTTVFLAPAPWTPQNYQTTLMMPYVGAYATRAADGTPIPQWWLNTSVVSLKGKAPKLPPGYILPD